MGEEILLKDGVRYLPCLPKSEEELEKSIKEHAKEIFGEETLYFDIKKRIASITGEKSIPDGYLVNFKRKEVFLVEIELSSHPEYDHIQKQVGKFTQALQNYKTRQKIASVLKEYIERDIIKKKFVLDQIEREDIYQFLLEEILEEAQKQEFQIIVIIDKKTLKLDVACGVIMPTPKIIEFKTYTREGVEGIKVHIHQFESMGKELPPDGLEKIFSKNKTGEESKRIFNRLRDFILSLDNVSELFQETSCVYKVKKRFVVLYPRKYCVSLYFPKNIFLRDPQNLLIRHKVLGKYLKIDSEDQIPYAKDLIQQAQEKAKIKPK